MKWFAPLSAFLMLLSLGAQASPPGSEKPYAPPKDPIVMAGDGCTGWYIGNNLFVTASHCVEGPNMVFTFKDGSQVKGKLAILSNLYAGFDDFAVFKATDSVGYSLSLAMKCDTVPNIGDSLHMTGYPGGKGGIGRTTMWGRAASEVQPQHGLWPGVYTVQISSLGGFSGSPVMNEAGKVVGILVGSEPENKTIAFVQPIGKLCGILGLH